MKTNEHEDYESPQVFVEKCQFNSVILKDSSPDNGGIEKTNEEKWLNWWE